MFNPKFNAEVLEEVYTTRVVVKLAMAPPFSANTSFSAPDCASMSS